MRALPLLILLLVTACGRQDEGGNQNAPTASAGTPTGKLDRSHAGTPAPETEFQDPDGEPVSLADFKGKPLLVNLWATWCAPCVEEMPTLDALAAREGDRLQVLAVSQDLEGREKVDRFLEERKLDDLEAYLDPQMALMGKLGVGILPTTILYDAQGREVWRMRGMEDWQSPRTARLIGEASRAAAR
ncbi:MAG TPA: TlpA disulfide reductase family protein [Allosphingosinicella sp.]|jgi:thiol-disulfide isomerase/thioredoxin